MMTMDDAMQADASISSTARMDWKPINRAGALDKQQIMGQSIEQDVLHRTPIKCSYTDFYDHNVLLPNGDVYLCCMDYSLKHKLGNLLTTDYYDLFGLIDLRTSNMQYRCDGSICRNCSRAKTMDVSASQHQFWELNDG
jgi:hypothetical protein